MRAGREPRCRVRPGLRALDYDYRSSGKRLGNCCIVEYNYDPAAGLSVCNIYNPND